MTVTYRYIRHGVSLCPLFSLPVCISFKFSGEKKGAVYGSGRFIPIIYILQVHLYKYIYIICSYILILKTFLAIKRQHNGCEEVSEDGVKNMN